MGVIFGMEESNGAQKGKKITDFLPKFVSHQRILCAIFTKNFQGLWGSSDGPRIKIQGNSIKGFQSYRCFNLRGSIYPQTFSAPQQSQIPKCFTCARMCSWYSITMSSSVGLGMPPGEPKMLSFLSVSFVTLSVENVVKFEVFAFLLQHGIAAY